MINNISFPGFGWEFEISRVAFNVFGMPVYIYGLLIGIGLLLALIYASYETGRIGMLQDDLFNMLLIALPVSIICARVYYVIFQWDEYKNNLSEIFNIRGGGIAIYGAVIGAAAVVYTYCRIKKLIMGRWLDILAIGLLIGQAVGRWGNFVNGEAYGSTTNLPWSMTIVQDGITIAERVHPTFIYESLWNIVGIVLLWLYRRHKKFDGELFCGYMIWYGIGRLMIEGLRADSLMLGNFRVSQLLSAGLVMAGIIIVILKRKSLKNT